MVISCLLHQRYVSHFSLLVAILQSSTSSGVVDTLRTQLQTLEEERDGMVRKIRDLQATIARHKDEKETIARRLSEKDRSVHEQHMTIEQLQTNLGKVSPILAVLLSQVCVCVLDCMH